MMNFAAIDFETATAARNSACSVAVVEIKNGKVADSYYTLIKPPANRYNRFNIKIHGIHPQDTADAPEFAAVWPELNKHLAGKILVAHNAAFDMSVLGACLADACITPPAFSYCDTVAISRRVWPNLNNHKLDTVGSFLQIDFKHHNALDDAKTCAAIPLAASEELLVQDIAALAKKTGVRLHNFNC